jgi:hypothetical protein
MLQIFVLKRYGLGRKGSTLFSCYMNFRITSTRKQVNTKRLGAETQSVCVRRDRHNLPTKVILFVPFSDHPRLHG